jgi:hypothetical protein
MNVEDMKARCLAHTALRAEIERQGLLYAHERELLLDTADALLFDELEAQIRLEQAAELLAGLEATERRSAGETNRLRDALEGCGERVLVA